MNKELKQRSNLLNSAENRKQAGSQMLLNENRSTQRLIMLQQSYHGAS